MNQVLNEYFKMFRWRLLKTSKVIFLIFSFLGPLNIVWDLKLWDDTLWWLLGPQKTWLQSHLRNWITHQTGLSKNWICWVMLAELSHVPPKNWKKSQLWAFSVKDLSTLEPRQRQQHGLWKIVGSFHIPHRKKTWESFIHYSHAKNWFSWLSVPTVIQAKSAYNRTPR